MTLPIFYSLPPAGNKIHLRTIIQSIKEVRGESTESLFEPIKNYLGARHLFYLSSGRAALWLILKTLSGISPGRKEVVLPAYTCPAVASAVLKVGLNPILCDNNLFDFGFSIKGLQEKVGKNTLAVSVVHLFGYPANINEVKELCKEHSVFVIEDAAQAFGNSLLDSSEKKLGLLGDAGFFSFGRGKPVSLMHGGLLVTNSEEIFAEAQNTYRSLNHGVSFPNLRCGMILGSYSAFSNPYLYWISQRIPFLHLGETIFEPDFVVSQGCHLAGSLIRTMTESLEREKGIRVENSRWYSENLVDLLWAEMVPSGRYPYLRYPFLIRDKGLRDQILDQLMSRGTGAAIFYPCPLNELSGLREVLRDGTVYANAKRLADSLITLPVHSGVSERIRNRIRNIVQQSVNP